jgi:hypothetical protein
MFDKALKTWYTACMLEKDSSGGNMIDSKNMRFAMLRYQCEYLGAPAFETDEEMLEWALRFFKSQKGRLLSALEPFIELVSGIDSPLFRSVRRFLLRLLRKFQAQQRSSLSIKAIFTPLRLNPHSLHPNGLATN